MKELLKRSRTIVILLLFACIVLGIATNAFGAFTLTTKDKDGKDTGKVNIPSTAEFGKAIYDNKKSAARGDVGDFVGKTMGVNLSSEGKEDIAYSDATCMYHRQAGAWGNPVKIVGVVDIDFTTDKKSGIQVSFNGQSFETNDNDKDLAMRMAYAVTKATSGAKTGNRETTEKSGIRYLWGTAGFQNMFTQRNLLPKSFYQNVRNNNPGSRKDYESIVNEVMNTDESKIIKAGARVRLFLGSNPGAGGQNEIWYVSDYDVEEGFKERKETKPSEPQYNTPEGTKPDSREVSENASSIPHDDETPDELYVSIKKVDDRDNTKPLPGIKFKFSVQVKVYELQSSDTQDVYGQVPVVDSNGNEVKDEKGNTKYSQAVVRRWTRNHYKWVNHTAYLTDKGWVLEDGKLFETDKDGVINAGGKLNVYTDTVNDETEGNSRRKYARFVDNVVTAHEMEVTETTDTNDGKLYGYKENEGKTYTLNGNKVDGKTEGDLSGYRFKYSIPVEVYEQTGTQKTTRKVTSKGKVITYRQDFYDKACTKPKGKEYVVKEEDGETTTKEEEYTANVYEWKKYTAYLMKNGEWKIGDDGDIFTTNDKGTLSASGTLNKYTVVKDDIADKDKNYKLGVPYRVYARFAGEINRQSLGKEGSDGSSTSTDGSGDANSAKYPKSTVEAQHQKRVMISGYVWLDKATGKLSTTNGTFDTSEQGVNGVHVMLKDASGKTVQEIGPSAKGACDTTTSELGLYDEIEGGEYRFENVDLDQLLAGAYHVEFEYCGVQYQSVIAKPDQNPGSKAVDDNARKILDSKFNKVDGNGSENLDVNGVGLNYEGVNEYKSTMKEHMSDNTEGPITYTREIPAHTGCEVTASTNETSYKLQEHFEPRQKEIRYVNLGLFKKAQTDYALTKDLHNVRVEVNGRAHVYKYGAVRYNADDTVNEGNSWNVGVKWQSNAGTYNRPIYESDAYYAVEGGQNGASNKLQIYLTYKIAMKNESVYNGRINEIVDYFDNRLELTRVGHTISDDQLAVQDDSNIGRSTAGYNEEYSKGNIQVNTEINSGDTQFVYLEFKVNDQGVMDLVNDQNGVLINNVAEIQSYTTFKDGTKDSLAVYDNDSVPGNTVPGTIDTYEDDTDAARTFKLELTDARKITGTVFVDGTGMDENNPQTGKERQGNGVIDDGETKLANIEVQLVEIGNDGTRKPATRYTMDNKGGTTSSVRTDANGNYEISGFLPGLYEVQYTWGNKTYKVQYYKGTVYDENRTSITGQNLTEASKAGDYAGYKEFWYKGYQHQDTDGMARDYDINPYTFNYSANDASDDWGERVAIDGQMTDYKDNYQDASKNPGINTLEDRIDASYADLDENGQEKQGTGTGEFTTKINSYTPNMEVGVGYDTIVTDANNDNTDNVSFTIAQVDFGIVRRPLQQLNVEKRVSGYKLTLSNGQVLVDAKYNEQKNKFEGTMENTSFPQLGPDGLIRTEMDNELIDGAQLEITYKITVANQGEIDYNSERYYKYGNKDGAELVKVSPSQILDYVDKKLVVDATTPSDNLQTTWNEANDTYNKDYNVSQKDNTEYLNNVRGYVTKTLSQTYIDPGKTGTVYLTTTKKLASSDDNQFENKVEVTEAKKNKGDNTSSGSPVKITMTKANDVDTKTFTTSNSEIVEILPSTGANKDVKTPVILGISVIAVLGVGIFVIKKFIVDRKKQSNS